MRRSKTNEVAEGCMTFIQALTNEHHANKIDVLKEVAKLCLSTANREEGLNPNRNK
tara:strand:- start:1329 stop:1496 length:168 start_codon:yes stop_codon:yes gene_type:complete